MGFKGGERLGSNDDNDNNKSPFPVGEFQPIFIKNIACGGNEAQIRDCAFNWDGVRDCYHNRDAVMQCSEPANGSAPSAAATQATSTRSLEN